jgi:hypothetical protein
MFTFRLVLVINYFGLGNQIMHTMPFKKPPLTLTKFYQENPLQAVAIQAGINAEHQGGNRVNQDEAALIAVRLLNQGIPADIAIESAVKSVLQSI